MRMMGKTRKAEAIPAPFADDETTEAVEQAKAASNANKAKLEATAEKAKERQAINDLIQSGKNRGHKESLRERRHSLSNEGSAVVTTASTSTSPATSFSGSSPATSFTTSEADVINKLMAASNIKPSAMKERHRTVSAPSPNAIETNEINKLIAAATFHLATPLVVVDRIRWSISFLTAASASPLACGVCGITNTWAWGLGGAGKCTIPMCHICPT